jgi:hypothetical protein
VLVDPQGQGRLWLMNREEANQLKVTQINDKMFRNHLEDCLTFGKVCRQQTLLQVAAGALRNGIGLAKNASRLQVALLLSAVEPQSGCNCSSCATLRLAERLLHGTCCSHHMVDVCCLSSCLQAAALVD